MSGRLSRKVNDRCFRSDPPQPGRAGAGTSTLSSNLFSRSQEPKTSVLASPAAFGDPRGGPMRATARALRRLAVRRGVVRSRHGIRGAGSRAQPEAEAKFLPSPSGRSSRLAVPESQASRSIFYDRSRSKRLSFWLDHGRLALRLERWLSTFRPATPRFPLRSVSECGHTKLTITTAVRPLPLPAFSLAEAQEPAIHLPSVPSKGASSKTATVSDTDS